MRDSTNEKIIVTFIWLMIVWGITQCQHLNHERRIRELEQRNPTANPEKQ